MTVLLSSAGISGQLLSSFLARFVYGSDLRRRRLSILSSLAEREASVLATLETESESVVLCEGAVGSAAESVCAAESSNASYETALSVGGSGPLSPDRRGGVR